MSLANTLLELAIDEPGLIVMGLLLCAVGIFACAWCIAHGYPRDRRYP